MRLIGNIGFMTEAGAVGMFYSRPTGVEILLPRASALAPDRESNR